MSLNVENIPQAIREAKVKLRQSGGNFKDSFEGMTSSIQAEIDEIKALQANGDNVIPELNYADLLKAGITESQQAIIRKRGCVIVRDTFPVEQAQEWNQQIADYLDALDYVNTPDKGLDKYFSSLQQGKPQIFSVYWSKPQIMARQSENMAITRRHLNRVWNYQHEGEPVFDPDRECTYADRVRRREPGDNSLGLKPHIDGGSVERWIDEQGFRKVFRHLIDGNWQAYEPFDAAFRNQTQEIPSPAVCSMFRTYQGWVALTPQGPGDGTLNLVPISRALAWMFLRALQDDVPDDELCGAMAARALLCDPKWHALLLEALMPIPKMQPGDTVWWHPDVIHAVEDQHQGQDYSNVMYIGAAPYCQKNADYLKAQADAFLAGNSAPDFAAENYELNFEGRATEDDLSELGKIQMGLAVQS